MTASHFGRVVVAELRKVFTRGTGLLALAVAVGVGVVTTLLLDQADNADNISVMGRTLGEMVNASATDGARLSLWVRNLFLEPVLLVLAAATAIASEHSDRTLREVLVRPVPRWAVLASRASALGVLSVSTLVLTLVASLALGVPMFGFPEPAPGSDPVTLPSVLLAYGLCLFADLGLIVWTMAVSLVVRSTGLVLVGMTIALLVDALTYAILTGLGAAGVQTAASLAPFTMYSALHAWQPGDTGYEPLPFLILAGYTLAAGAFALIRFQRLDTP